MCSLLRTIYHHPAASLEFSHKEKPAPTPIFKKQVSAYSQLLQGSDIASVVALDLGAH